MVTYKLTYFDLRGHAELSRYVFAAVGQKFEDCRVSSDTWKTLKQSTPFEQLPILEVDGKVLAQGNAIARYLARELGLAGANSWEQALCDQYIELGIDLGKEIATVFYEKDETKKQELMKNLQDVLLPKYMKFYEESLKANGKTYLVGNTLSVADLICLTVFDSPMMTNPQAMDRFPVLRAHRDRVLDVPGISAYVDNRNHTDI